MFRIGAFSKISGLTTDTLYHYERLGLLRPARVDGWTGYRYYEAAQLAVANRILALKDAGFALEEIVQILEKQPSAPQLIHLLEEKAALLEARLAAQNQQLDRLYTSIFQIKNGGIPLMNEITLKRVEPLLMVTVRRSFDKAGFDENLEEMWAEANRAIDEKKGRRSNPCLMLYHTGFWDLKSEQNPDGKDQLDVEVAEPVMAAFAPSGNAQVRQLPAAEKMVCAVHKGPFSTIGPVFEALFSWVKQNGYTQSGPLREIYHKGDWATDDPGEYITELQLPVE